MTTAEAPDYAPAWHAWIAENLVRGAQPQDIEASMIAQGLDHATAQRAVALATAHPYLKGARTAVAAGLPGAAPAIAAEAVGPDDARARKYAWFLEVLRRNAQLGAGYGVVPRVQAPTPQAFLDEFYARNAPVVIEGALSAWPALELWQDPAYLKAKVGDAAVEVQGNRASNADYEVHAFEHKTTMAFSAFADLAESGVESNDCYMTAGNASANVEALRGLRADLGQLDYLTADPDQGALWYGPAGVITPTHHDLTNGLMAQVRGRKQVRLVAPFESAHISNDRHCFSPVDLFAVDEERFPDMHGVTVLDVELGPGDLLFVPVGWWHAVRGLDVSMTMTFTNFIYPNEFTSFYSTYQKI